MDMRERLRSLKGRRVTVHFRTAGRDWTDGVVEDVPDGGEVVLRTGVPGDDLNDGHDYFSCADILYVHVKEKIERKGA